MTPYITLMSGAAKVISAGSSGSGVRLKNSGHGIYYNFSGISQLPAGRYLGYARVRATGNNYSTFKRRVWNQNDSRALNMEKDWKFETVRTGNGWVYRGLEFDIDSRDSANDVRYQVWMSGAMTSGIDVDYFLMVPIANGQAWPQDLAHNALRTYTKRPAVVDR